MLRDANKYFDFVSHLELEIDSLTEAICCPKTPLETTHTLRVRREALKQVKQLATGDTKSLS
jgi:aconitase A